MIIHEVPHYSAEWWKLRIGHPTASAFGSITTPKTWKPSAQADGYMNRLLAEWATGMPVDSGASRWTERGQEVEPEAWRWYEMQYDVDIVRGGFCIADYGAACSPDGRIYDGDRLAEGVELKCPAPWTHIGYLRDPASLVAEYRTQLIGSLVVTGADVWRICSYHPRLPAVVMPVYAALEQKRIDTMREHLIAFCGRLEEAKAELRALGVAPHAKESNG